MRDCGIPSITTTTNESSIIAVSTANKKHLYLYFAGTFARMIIAFGFEACDNQSVRLFRIYRRVKLVDPSLTLWSEPQRAGKPEHCLHLCRYPSVCLSRPPQGFVQLRAIGTGDKIKVF